MMTKKRSRVIAAVMLLLAVAFISFALNHPQAGFPWSNAITYLLYGLYAVSVAVLFIAPFEKTKLLSTETVRLRPVPPEERTEPLIEKLCGLWERSVKATHLFLSAKEIAAIAACVPMALWEVPQLVVVTNHKQEPIGFMGIEHQKLEMLFLSPDEMGKGLGRKLLQYGIERYGVNELGVNEQNPHAKCFYERMGFRVFKRTDRDEQGNPYPILYMRLDEN